MSRTRTLVLVLLLALGAPLVLGMGAAGWVLWDMPTAQGDRLRGPHGLVGVQSGGSYAWVVPSDSGVVLIDAGLDPSAAPILREVGTRKVQAVVLTHAHGDHVAGLAALGDVPVYIGPDERPLLAGEESAGGWLARWFAMLMNRPAVPADLTEVTDGQELLLDGVRLRAVHVPGHTRGSTAWLWEDVLFSGDAVLSGNPPTLPPTALSTDPEQAAESVRKLLPLDFDWLADGHSGLVDSARSGVYRLVGERPEDPTISLREPEQPSAETGPLVHLVGRYVQAPLTGPDGLRPAILLLEGGEEWLMATAPVPAHATLWGRRVDVRGRSLAPEHAPGVPSGGRLVVESIELADGETASDGTLPSLTVRADLEGAVGTWALVPATIVDLDPLALGATWGEGRATLSDDSEWPLSAPADTPTGVPLTLLARVTRTGGELRLVAPMSCPADLPCP